MKKAPVALADKSDAASAAPGRKPMFQQEQVVRAALDLVERHGHGALSMRAIAAELRTGVATLYNYFGSLAELNDALAITLLDGIPLVDAKDLRETRRQLKALVIAYANILERHQMTDPEVHYLAKPFQPTALVARVRAVLSGHPTRPESRA